MTTARAWWRQLPSFMAKPKSPWGGGGSGDDSGDPKNEGSGPNDDDAGPRNPWAQPPGGRPRSGRVSSLDDLLKRARSGGGGGGGNGGGGGGFKLPPGAGSRNMWLGGAGLVLIAWIALTSFHVIGPQERGVVTYFGKYSGTLSPGWNTTLPAPIAAVQVIDVNSIRTFQFPENGGANLVLTEDQYLVDLGYTVRWRIVDPQKYVFELKGPDDTVKSAAESAVRAVIANTSLDKVLGPGKGLIETQVTQAMQRILDEYQSGIRIVGASLNNASAPAAAMDAFNQVTVAQQEYAKNVNAARAYSQSLVANAEGEAQSFDRVYAQYKLAPEVTRRRMYYETMEQILGQTNKTIVEPRGVAPFLPILPNGTRLANPPQGAQ